MIPMGYRQAIAIIARTPGPDDEIRISTLGMVYGQAWPCDEIRADLAREREIRARYLEARAACPIATAERRAALQLGIVRE